jgi:hypothetical protein
MSSANEWITDRLPTEADGDGDGDVRMVLRPNVSDDYNFAHWSHIGLGVPWQHTRFWEPPTEPATTEPDRIAALEQRVAELAARIAQIDDATARAFHLIQADLKRARQ